MGGKTRKTRGGAPGAGSAQSAPVQSRELVLDNSLLLDELGSRTGAGQGGGETPFLDVAEQECGVRTDFGTFEVVPEGTKIKGKSNQITQKDLDAAKQAWGKVKNGSGGLKITETDGAGTAHSGFLKKMLTNVAKLMTTPTGRKLIIDVVNAGKTTTVRPKMNLEGGANIGPEAYPSPDQLPDVDEDDGTITRGKGYSTIIEVDPEVKDDTIMVRGADGKEISNPTFLILGHELIHARHAALGEYTKNEAATKPGYRNLEEQRTIASGEITENLLRQEHGQAQRVGHKGRDTRFEDNRGRRIRRSS